ncbi:MAG: hypothetical protein GTO14_17540, partial [Anaerolineales bacterium]|nr:hypothetical protein [Anaerolineales bacterium]
MDWSDLTALGNDFDYCVKAGVWAFESNDTNDWELFLPLSNIGLDTTTQLATIGSGKSLTCSFKAECLYGFHVIKKLNSSGNMEWVDVNSEDNSEKKPWWRVWR